jgi:hypothetical protein
MPTIRREMSQDSSDEAEEENEERVGRFIRGFEAEANDDDECNSGCACW